MKERKALIFHVLLQVLVGFTIAFFSNILIYFKQKETLHLAVILFTVFVIYYLSYLGRRNIKAARVLKTSGIIILLLICCLGPQFIYQIRPHTFYIGGFVIGGSVIMALTTSALSDQKSI